MLNMVDAVREGQGHVGSTPTTSTIFAVVPDWVRRLFRGQVARVRVCATCRLPAVVFFWITTAGRRGDGVFAHALLCGGGGLTERLGQSPPPTHPKIVVINVVGEREDIRQREAQELLAIDQAEIFVRADGFGEKLTLVDLQNDFSVAS